MTLTNNAYLEIEGTSSTATFELGIGLGGQSNISKSYLMGERGQYIREIVNQTPATGSFDEQRRTGFWIDGGAGDWEETLSFKTGLEDVQWGDGSGGEGQGNVTQTDASGKGVKPISRKQILDYWVAKSKSDSGGSTRIHFGEWTDGNITHISGVNDGAFGEPMAVAIKDLSVNLPDPDQGDQVSVEGKITMSHVARWGGYDAPDWASDAEGAIEYANDIIPDA